MAFSPVENKMLLFKYVYILTTTANEIVVRCCYLWDELSGVVWHMFCTAEKFVQTSLLF